MFKPIDYFLDRITMYRLVLYVLIALLSIALLLSFLGIIKISYTAIIFSSVFLVLVNYLINKIFAYVLKVPANVESVYITALILSLIITPSVSVNNLLFLFSASFLAMASKYILAISKRHIFNPAAIAVVLTGFILHQYASWWIGNLYMAPFVFVLGFLIIRKIRKEEMVLSFFAVSLIASVLYTLFSGSQDVVGTIQRVFFETPLLFFAFVMLTEPLTSPATKKLQIIYGVITAILLAPQFNFFGFYFLPETALIVGNIFSYVFSPNYKLFLNLSSKNKLSSDTFEFNFPKDKKFNFIPGQYMEWALPHDKTDSRGNRRYFSLSSSPTEDKISMTVKFYENSSSFKKELINLKEKKIIASSLAGDFTMPKDLKKPMVFIAGGVGITPFRSMVKYITDKNLKCDIILIYSNKTEEEILFKKIFDDAGRNGIKTLYVLTSKEKIPKDWKGLIGHISGETIKKEIPDFKNRMFYISGPQLMVQNLQEMLRNLRIKQTHIKTDFFPGYTEVK